MIGNVVIRSFKASLGYEDCSIMKKSKKTGEIDHRKDNKALILILQCKKVAY